MKNKKVLALLMTATLLLGSSMTALAADDQSGNTTGTGTSEGHVEKTLTNVTLPTVAEGTAPFAYTMDPEGLITDTEGGKYGDDVTFPEAANDTGVYFLTAEKTYENESQALTVTNESSHSIELTVKAEVATPAATDIALVAKDDLATAEDAALYLGLVVGSEDAQAVSADAAATKTVTLAGKPDNFKVAVKADKSGYEYRVLTLDEYKAITGNESKTEIEWENTTFKLEGATTKDKEISATTTAPTLKVTWSWVDPAATPAEVTGHIEYVSNQWWLTKSDTEKFADDAVLGDVTINGQEITAKLDSYDGGKWVVISWSDYVSAGYDQDEVDFEIKAEVNGTVYVTNYHYGS